MKKILLFLLFIISTQCFAYYFGENKVQTKHTEWEYLKTLHFDVYYDKNDKEFGKIAAYISEKAYYYLKQDFVYPIKGRIPIIFYNTQHTFINTNVLPSILNNAVGGFTEITKNRIVIPFKGDYKELEAVLIHELTHAYINDLDSNNFSILTLGRIPFWFSEGLPEFESKQGKDKYNNMFVADLLMNGKLYNLEGVGGYYAYREGESFLSFINDVYGRKTILKYYYAIKLSSNIDAATKKIFGMDFEQIQERWKDYLKKRYFPYYKNFSAPTSLYEEKTRHLKDGSYINFSPKFNTDGTDFLYFSNKTLRTAVYKASTYDLFSPNLIIEGEKNGKLEDFHMFRNNLSRFPKGDKFAFAATSVKGDRIYIVSVKKKKIIQSINPGDFEAIFEIDISKSGDKIVFSAQKNHQTDLFIYNLKTKKLLQLTNDRYADIQPAWNKDDTKIAFCSDRILNKNEPHTFYALTKNIFYYDLKTKKFYNVTDDDYENEFPIWSKKSNRIIFASRKNFNSNFDVIDLNTGKRAQITHTFSGVFNSDLDDNDENLIFSAMYNGGWDIYIMAKPFENLKFKNYHMPKQFDFKNDFNDKFPITQLKYLGYKKLKFKRELPNYTSNSVTKFKFGHPLERDSLNKKYNINLDKIPTTPNPPVSKPYKPKFSIDQLWGGMAYSPTNGTYVQLLMRLSDVMGNHGIGINLGIDRNIANTDVILNYIYLARRIDYGLGIFRLYNDYIYQVTYQHSSDVDYFRERVSNYGLFFMIRYPFNRFWKVDFENIIQQLDVKRDWWDWNDNSWYENYLPDYMQMKTSEKTTYSAPQVSLVHDNTIYGNVGPIDGWRLALLTNLNLSTHAKTYSQIYGDFRDYFYFPNKFVFAMKLTGGTYLGKFPYGYQLDDMTDVRGYSNENEIVGEDVQGKNKFCGSLEFRFPFIDHLKINFPLPMNLYYIRGSAFTDFGAVWDKKHSFMVDGRLNELKLTFGAGPRINFGYFVIKMDVAWQTDLERVSKGRFYISLSEDF